MRGKNKNLNKHSVPALLGFPIFQSHLPLGNAGRSHKLLGSETEAPGDPSDSGRMEGLGAWALEAALAFAPDLALLSV